jgi:hypothetical protein
MVGISFTGCKPEIYAVIDAMNGIVGDVNKPRNKVSIGADCPCPKCNPETSQTKWEITEPDNTKVEPAN